MRRALVLRAQDDAARTAQKLREMGVEPIISPVLEVVGAGAAIPPGDYDAVLASSAKGVEFAPRPLTPPSPRKRGEGEEPQRRGSLPLPVERGEGWGEGRGELPQLHAVGAKTAAAAESLGWRIGLVAGEARDLLPLIAARHPKPAHFLYLAGRDRQPDLETGLAAQGHATTVVETYEARAAAALSAEAIAALRDGAPLAALHYSRRSVEIFLALVEAAGLAARLPALDHFALSDNVAQALRRAGLAPRVAQRPDEAHVLRLLAEEP